MEEAGVCVFGGRGIRQNQIMCMCMFVEQGLQFCKWMPVQYVCVWGKRYCSVSVCVCE